MWYTSAYKDSLSKIDGDGSLFIASWLPKDALKALDHFGDIDQKWCNYVI